jgi:hypothetical protein
VLQFLLLPKNETRKERDIIKLKPLAILKCKICRWIYSQHKCQGYMKLSTNE